MDNRKLALTKPHFKTTIFKSFLSYLRKNYPHIRAEDIVATTGLDLDYFLNENNWVSVEVERKFVEACLVATGEKNLSYKVGKTALSKENIGALTYHFARHIVPISEFFDRLPKMTAIVNRVFSVKTIRGSPHSVDIEYSINRSVVSDSEFNLLTESFPSIMENIRGYFHAITDLKKCPTPKIEYHIEMTADGSPIARFRVVYARSKTLGIAEQFGLATFLGATTSAGLSWQNLDLSTWALKAAITLPAFWLIALFNNYRKLKNIARETENSLSLLDTQYTELHQTKQMLMEQLSESKLINDISSALLSVSDEESLLKTACEGLIQHIGFDRVVVLLYNEKSEQLIFSVSAGKDSQKLGSILGGFSLNLTKANVSENAISSVFRSGKPLLVSNTKKYLNELTEEASKQALRATGSAGFACTPIRTGDTKYGIMLADVTDTKLIINDHKLQLLSIVANQMAIFLEKQRAKQSLVEAYQSEVMLAQAYSRFVPMETLTMLNYSSVHDVNIGDGVERDLTVMFTDIREFTSLCETMTPSEVLKFLNSYYARLSPIVRSHNGIIDKFVGDGLMAIFTNFEDALNAAVEMQRELVKYNLEKRIGRRKPLVAGVGIAKGPVIFGPLGADKRLQLTVLSDSVNLASRLDSLCSQFNASIMITGADLSELPNRTDIRLRPFGSTTVKGKSKQVDVLEVIDTNVLNGLNDQYTLDIQTEYINALREDLAGKVSASKQLDIRKKLSA